MPVRKTNPFKLRAFRGFDSNVITILAAIQVKTTSQMLPAGQTTKKRSALANRVVFLKLTSLSW
jgi:hypothetical protein